MKRFTLMLALVTIVAFAFGQRTTQIEQFSKTNPMTAKKFMPAIGEKSTNALVVTWGEYFVDSASGTNGLPANFSYTPNSTDIRDQWQWQSASGEGRIGRGWYEDKPISETFYTDAHTVPSTNPGLYVTFSNSYYWAIDQGTDSLEVSYSIDGGNNWVRIWSNRDQALCEAAALDWPYPSWELLTARIPLDVTLIGSNMEFKFTYEGGTANGIYVYSIEMVEMPDYDLAMNGYIAENYVTIDDTDYFDGLYQLLPVDQKRNFEYFGAALKNYGQASATNITFSNTFKTQWGTLIAQKDTNFFVTGATDLINYTDVDTFDVNIGFDNIDAAYIGQYVLEGSISYDNIDVDASPTTNSWSIGIEYDQPLPYNSGNVSHLARNTDITGQLSVDNYSGGAENDMLGMSFYVSQHAVITGAQIPLGSLTENNTGFAARVYAWNSGTGLWEQIAYADDYYASAADAGTTVSVDLVNPVELLPDTAYMLVCAAKFTAGVSRIYFSTYGGYKDYNNTSYLNRYASVLNLGGTWYYISSVPSMIAVLEAPTSVNTLSVNENVKVYPNPTNGILHIDNVAGATVKVYNMLGAMVEVIDNANEFNTINLSNYAEGTYLVKVFTEEGVVVEKINVTK